MTSDSHTPPRAPRSLQLWTALRDDLAVRRQRRAEQRTLERELATYTSPAEINELLTLMQDEDGDEVEMIRSILAGNQQQAARRLAS